jgi:hypothetical protein
LFGSRSRPSPGVRRLPNFRDHQGGNETREWNGANILLPKQPTFAISINIHVCDCSSRGAPPSCTVDQHPLIDHLRCTETHLTISPIRNLLQCQQHNVTSRNHPLRILHQRLPTSRTAAEPRRRSQQSLRSSTFWIRTPSCQSRRITTLRRLHPALSHPLHLAGQGPSPSCREWVSTFQPTQTPCQQVWMGMMITTPQSAVCLPTAARRELFMWSNC